MRWNLRLAAAEQGIWKSTEMRRRLGEAGLELHQLLRPIEDLDGGIDAHVLEIDLERLGYLTIPTMALSGFLLILTLLAGSGSPVPVTVRVPYCSIMSPPGFDQETEKETHDLIGDLQALKQRLQSGGDMIAGPRLEAMAALVETTIDAIREFEMLTSTYDASFGRNPGAQVNVILNSGSNDFHGSLFEFHRNAALDARNFFASSSEPKPKYIRNQFGGVLGGPIKRDRTFFFADYEGTRSRDGRVGRLRSGAALLAAEHHLPIVPIHVSGTREAMPRGHRWMVFKAGRPGPRHPLEIRFGKPIAPRGDEHPSEVMERVRLFLAECGAETEREPHAEHGHRRQPA